MSSDGSKALCGGFSGAAAGIHITEQLYFEGRHGFPFREPGDRIPGQQ